ncbi:hypothetical protein CV_1245 [Chromobacterium violaceum ATCC 12472]|uniref:Uncharacterized protein n=1 Tax=Chromobacterium violaceum (strain ATCC 12472 / DSM 30191 / JCM 1249 / CCUG 213 / NBRC 12614 / NCIMB 9131 / NCTC 9757 / MK) TaxID=243365 RepID=Q7NYM8_CHRVO|nr:hypothetical protein CV_1245 [Chromobacterium violaceum ATCC 12472]
MHHQIQLKSAKCSKERMGTFAKPHHRTPSHVLVATTSIQTIPQKTTFDRMPIKGIRVDQAQTALDHYPNKSFTNSNFTRFGRGVHILPLLIGKINHLTVNFITF